MNRTGDVCRGSDGRRIVLLKRWSSKRIILHIVRKAEVAVHVALLAEQCFCGPFCACKRASFVRKFLRERLVAGCEG